MASYVFDPVSNELVDRDTYYAAKARAGAKNVSRLAFPYIRSDLPAYKSPATGKIIEGRAARREDLARSGCREVDPSEYKPTYRNYEFCQQKRLPYQGGEVPPPMTRDEKMAVKERKAKAKASEAKREAVLSAKARASRDPDAPFLRGSTKGTPLFKNNTVKD